MYSNYPPGVSDSTPDAPWNESEVPVKDFDVTCCQTLSRTATVSTNHYIPGASGVDYEQDGEGGYSTYGWQDPDDTSDTNWGTEYSDNGYLTPLQLIHVLKGYLEKDLEGWEKKDKETPNSGPAFQVRRLKSLIQECDAWDEVEIDFEQD